MTSNRRVSEPPDRRRAPRGGRRRTDHRGRHPILLIAEGYQGAREPFVRYLNRFGFQVVEAATGGEATAILDRVRPEVVLSDVSLKDGSALLARLTRDASGGGAAIILLATSAVASAGDAVAGVLVKPFRLGTMLEEIRRVLRCRETGSPENPGPEDRVRLG